MFQHKTTNEQLIEERNKNKTLRAQLDKASADLEYIAMMSDIDLDDEETEVDNDGAE